MAQIRTLSYQIFFFSDLCLPTHGRSRGLLFHPITPSPKHTHTHGYGQADNRSKTPGRGIGPSQGPLLVQHATITTEKHLRPRRDSKPQS